MSCDKLVYDLAQEVEGSPNVFIRKDWLNILDNQNQNYQGNQSVIDTSQLANSNKYMSYREGYLALPLLLTLAGDTVAASSTYTFGDYSIGLKNWFGSNIHSMTLDYNGTTVVQQTNFCNMWNTFKLLTTLSYNDLITQGPTIGFYPDNSGSWAYWDRISGNGYGVCNNDICRVESDLTYINTNNYDQYLQLTYDKYSAAGPPAVFTTENIIGVGGNNGFSNRLKWISFDTASGINTSSSQASLAYSSLLSSTSTNLVWKSYISNNISASTTVKACIQISVMATVYLKHLHSFFNMCPLLKGVFMKMTLTLNNATTSFKITPSATNPKIGVETSAGPPIVLNGYTNIIPSGGVNPIMIPSARTGSAWMNNANTVIDADTTFYYNLSVGQTVTDNTVKNITGVTSGKLASSIYLYLPAYTFNPTFEQAYLSNNIKQIKYTDIYQYPVKNVKAGSQINQLITNGLANIKSVLIIPFLSKNGYSTLDQEYSEYQSPFDPAGTGCTAPLATLNNFNIQVSGQNAIYNTQRYTFEEWNNQLYGQNAVNGGLTDGLTSGLISFSDFQNSYCYYYVNVERMLPVEQSVPKSIQLIGQNASAVDLDFIVFVEFGVSVSIDVLTGARV